VTAAKLLAEVALNQKQYFQAFPEYGPERMGAPIQAFTRISQEPITLRCSVESPEIVVVLDQTLLTVVNVLEGMKKGGIIIVNSPETAEKVRKEINAGKEIKVFTINATQVAIDTIGKPIPNTPMIGALIKASEIVTLENVTAHLKKSFGKKFSKEIVDGNIEAVKRAFKEVTSD
jgi:pyruvate ferredoxin oxidoreductase gamma subunit